MCDERELELVPKVTKLKSEILSRADESPVIKIEGDLKQKLLNFIDSDNLCEKKVLISAIKSALELNERDVIVCLSDCIVIRLFKWNNNERRFHGIPAQELEKFREDNFPHKYEIPKAIVEIVNRVLKDELDISKISNIYFMNNYIKIFQRYIFDFVRKKFPDRDKILVESFGNYIFRQNFSLVLTTISRKILKMLMEKDANAERFISYYDGNIDIDIYGKYKRPEIVDEENSQRVPIQKILYIVDSYRDYSENLKRITSKIDELKSRVTTIESAIEKHEPKDSSEYGEEFLTSSIHSIDRAKKEIEELRVEIERESLKREQFSENNKLTQEKFEHLVEILAKTLYKKREKLK